MQEARGFMKFEFRNFNRILKPKRATTSAVILAAGLGERFGGDKADALIGGKTVLQRSVEAFDRCPLIDEIIVVLPSDGFDEIKARVMSIMPPKVKHIVPGGETRQQSALLGAEATHAKAGLIAIHDAARCMVTPEMIEEVCRRAVDHRAAAAAHKVVDTVKYADDTGFIEKTLDRDHVWLVSTPQVFLANMYRAAMYTARDAKFEATDDCALVERIGFRVKLVEVGPDNIKITYKDDILRAEDILARRSKESGVDSDR